MLRTGHLIAATLAGLATVVATGCGNQAPSAEAIKEAPIRNVGVLYRMYSADHQKPPASPDDLRGYQQVAPVGYKVVKEGDVVVNWDVTLTDLSQQGGQESSDEVLAYEKEVPEKGGNVLMKDRTVRTMTPDEFKAAKKASKG